MVTQTPHDSRHTFAEPAIEPGAQAARCIDLVRPLAEAVRLARVDDEFIRLRRSGAGRAQKTVPD